MKRAILTLLPRCPPFQCVSFVPGACLSCVRTRGGLRLMLCDAGVSGNGTLVYFVIISVISFLLFAPPFIVLRATTKHINSGQKSRRHLGHSLWGETRAWCRGLKVLLFEDHFTRQRGGRIGYRYGEQLRKFVRRCRRLEAEK